MQNHWFSSAALGERGGVIGSSSAANSNLQELSHCSQWEFPQNEFHATVLLVRNFSTPQRMNIDQRGPLCAEISTTTDVILI